MDIFQCFLSHHDENASAFSSYLLNHYLSMFFRLITEMDFCALEDEIE